MRNMLALLLALVCCMSCAGALELPYAEDTILSALDLTESQRQLAEFLYEPLFRHEEKIQLPEGTLYDDVPMAMESVMRDYPEMFHVDKLFYVRYYVHKPEYAATLEPTYRCTAQEAAKLRSELYAKAYLMVQTYQDALILHDALCNSVVYGGDTEMRHTAPGALLQGIATCEGYAHALTLLYRMAGIPCGLVAGTALDDQGKVQPHGWNIADLDGYTLIDATWNDRDRNRYITHWFYGLSSQQMNVDHFADERYRVPYCGTGNNWHEDRGQLVYTKADADAAIARLVRGEVLNLRVPSAEMYQALTQGLYDYLGDYNNRHPEAPFYGRYSVVYSDTQQCVLIRVLEE